MAIIEDSRRPARSVNPDPFNYRIIRVQHWEGSPWIVAEVVYPDATNYEGRKVMIYRTTVENLQAQNRLDPHFCEHREHLSPFARFEPTEAGWSAAVFLARNLAAEEQIASEKGRASMWDRIREG